MLLRYTFAPLFTKYKALVIQVHNHWYQYLLLLHVLALPNPIESNILNVANELMNLLSQEEANEIHNIELIFFTKIRHWTKFLSPKLVPGEGKVFDELSSNLAVNFIGSIDFSEMSFCFNVTNYKIALSIIVGVVSR